MPRNRLSCLPPAVDRHTRVLILGSFPGEASLAARQYYAYRHNQFWSLLSAIVGEDLTPLNYKQRIRRINAHRIGLWDVIGSCERSGSLDTSIRNPEFNDFAVLKKRCPALALVCFNGKTAGRFATHFAGEGFETLVLPSSSPANAQRTFEQKLETWRGMLPYLG